MKLSYFSLAGKAEATRLMLDIGEIKYEDERFGFQEWKGGIKAVSGCLQVGVPGEPDLDEATPRPRRVHANLLRRTFLLLPTHTPTPTHTQPHTQTSWSCSQPAATAAAQIASSATRFRANLHLPTPAPPTLCPHLVRPPNGARLRV